MAETAHEHGHGHEKRHALGPFRFDDHEWHYIKIWAWLCGLLGVSLTPFFLFEGFGIVVMSLIVAALAFGIAFVKAYLVAKHFMHITFEPKYVVYICSTALAFMSLFFFFVAPDIMEHEGRNWNNVAADAATTAAHQGGDELTASEVYTEVCASCHGDNGDGDGPRTAGLRRPASFREARFWETRDRERIVLAIAEGGRAVGVSRRMPAYDHRFSEEHIEQLADVVMAFRPPPAPRRPPTPAVAPPAAVVAEVEQDVGAAAPANVEQTSFIRRRLRL